LERLRQIRELKDRIMAGAETVDRAIVALRQAVDEVNQLIREVYTLQTVSEKPGFMDTLSHRGLLNSLGFRQLARPLGLHGIASYSTTHQPYAQYLRTFCQRAEPAPVAIEPPRDTNVYMSESEALSQIRKEV
jgi:hypothetical protein